MPRASEPHQQHRQRQDHELRQDHALDDLGGQARALFQRLGHLHQHHTRVGLARLAPGPQVGHAHRFVSAWSRRGTAHFADQRGGVGIRHRQVGIAGDELALLPSTWKYTRSTSSAAAGGRRPARRSRRLALGEAGAGSTAWPPGGRSCASVAPARGRRAGWRCSAPPPGQRRAHRPQQQQRREHPVEDLAEQRALLAGGALLTAAGAGPPEAAAQLCDLFQAVAQAAHGGDAHRAPARSSCAGGGCRPRSRCC
jgi:hypothetical protein